MKSYIAAVPNVLFYCFLAFILILDYSINNLIQDTSYLRLIFYFLFICSISILCSYLKNKVITSIVALLITLYFILDFVLIIYHVNRDFQLDFFFFWYNRADALGALQRSEIDFELVILVLITSGIIFYISLVRLMNKLGSVFQENRKALTGSFLGLVFIGILPLNSYPSSEVYLFLKQIVGSQSGFEKVYLETYQKSIDNNISSKGMQSKDKFENNIFIFHLESINAEVLSDNITPSFLKIAHDGILVPKIQSGSVQTVRSQEVILCSILPSIHESFAFVKDPSDLNCLPKILKQLGYRTLFFQTYPDLSYGNTENFMRKIGFDEVHSADIMEKGDTQLDWGYVEDIFYKRVFNYLEKYKNDKVFAYIAVDSTNHYPFSTPNQQLLKDNNLTLPFAHPEVFHEQISNTTYVQDYFFGQMYEELYKPNYLKNTLMVAYGDHSWPIGMHSDNIFNERGAWQENFVSSMLIVPPQSENTQVKSDKVVTYLPSQIDIVPTMFDIVGVTGFKSYGSSFLDKDYQIKENGSKCVLSVQPYANRQMAIILGADKYIYDLSQDILTKYDLINDPQEVDPIIEKSDISLFKKQLEGCYPNQNP